MKDELTVRSHVGRDLQQTAALFKTDRVVVWEYVSNGLDYVDDGTIPTVYVHLDPERRAITITDNGRGMDWDGLRNYFTMHGENLDRKAGRGKRGLFGTGKSAAFGIAETLRITTVRARRRSRVELTRTDIKKMHSGDPVPVRTLECETPVDESTGTRVEIEGIRLKKIDQAGIIRYIQQHLAEMPANAKVYVNHHECEYREPAALAVRTFTPNEHQRALVGDVVLTIKIAGAPLEDVERGVAITSKGVLYERTLAGLEGKEFTPYLFGHLDVPALDEEAEKADISPFDMSRSLTLNIENPLVVMIYAFIGQKLEAVRQELVERERSRKETEEAKKLAREAREIAKAINEDFSEFREKVARIAAKSRGSVDRRKVESSADSEQLIPGSGIAASETDEDGGIGSVGGVATGGDEPRALGQHLTRDPFGSKSATCVSDRDSGRHTRGGFQVQFKNMGIEEMRAKYVREERTIYINLDHPQLVAARGQGSDEQKLFRQLSYEIAFSEYAIALASELDREGEYIEPSDSIVDIRATVNRLARRAAGLFA